MQLKNWMTTVVSAAALAMVMGGRGAVAQSDLSLESAGTSASTSGGGWVAAWQGSSSASGTSTPSACPSAAGLNDQTIRNIIFVSAGGSQVRLRVSNVGGSAPLRVGAVSIAGSSGTTASIGKAYRMTFSGNASTVIAAGGEALSDPLTLKVSALQSLAVSIYLPDKTGVGTQHYIASQNNYLAAGNQTANTASSGFTRAVTCWMFLSGLEVNATTNVLGTVVTLGDSITDGYQSPLNGNSRYPDDLARRLAAVSGNTLAVSNAGIAGNALLIDMPEVVYGVPASARLARDVLNQPGVRAVILLEGINDIGASSALAADLIQADEQIIAQVHAAGLKIYGGTLLPFGGSNTTWGYSYGTNSGEQQRQALNAWIRTGKAFDGVIDFDKALLNPQEPSEMLPAYDSGDHLHPNAKGYQVMANTVNIAQIIQGVTSN